MRTEFCCQMDIKSSCGRANIDCISASYVKIPKISFTERDLFGIKVQELLIIPNNSDYKGSFITKSVTINCKFKDDLVIDKEVVGKEVSDKDELIVGKVVKFAKKLESYLSLLFARFEVNPQNGLCYAEIDWETAKITGFCNSKIPRRWSMKTSQISELFWTQEQWNIDGECDHIIFSSYYEGIRANKVKSKYFHWFLILESLEKSKAYKKRFGKSKARCEKLCEFLQLMEIGKYHFQNEEHTLSKEILDEIRKHRNNLFHEGEQCNEQLLWHHLFPIVRTIVDVLIKNPNFLERIYRENVSIQDFQRPLLQ